MWYMQSLKDRNKVRAKFGFDPVTETQHKLDQKGLRVTYHNPNTGTFEFSPTQFSKAKTELVTANSLEEAVEKVGKVE